MNSELKVESTYGKGSIFSFELWQKIEDETPLGDYNNSAQRNDSEGDKKDHLYAPEAHILIVDDTKMNLTVAVKLLKRTAVNVTTADSGEYLAAFSDGWNYYITGNLRTLTVKNDRLPGDVNGDGKIDITDATEVQKFAAELIDMTEKQKQSADTNRDGRIDVTDATLIQMYVAGLIAEF